MKLSEYLKPALGVVFVAALAVGYYWFEHRPHPEEKETPGQALVIVTKSTNACFSDMVRVTGFIVPRREARSASIRKAPRSPTCSSAKATWSPKIRNWRGSPRRRSMPGAPAGRPGPISLRAPAAGLVTEVRTVVGAPASPQAGPMFRISVNNEIELDAEVPSVHLLKLNPGATVRISRDDAPDLVGRVRLISPQIDRATQLGHVRISLNNNPSLKVGMFARANIDAKRSCGVAVPRTAIDRLTVAGGQRQHHRDAKGAGRPDLRHLHRNP